MAEFLGVRQIVLRGPRGLIGPSPVANVSGIDQPTIRRLRRRKPSEPDTPPAETGEP